MNVMKFTGKAVALCFAAGIAAAALSACGDKKAEEPAQSGTENQPQVQTQAMDMQDLDMKPATEAEILEVLAFLPDPVATVYGEPIARKEIVDELVSQEVPLEIYKQIGEERLRQAMSKQIEDMVKDKIMLKKAEKAGFKPSAEFVTKEMKEEFAELPKEEQEEIEEALKERGLSIEEHMKLTSENPEIQKKAALSKFVHTEFLDKAKKNVSDEDVKKLYDENIEGFKKPEGVTVAHILIQLDEEKEAADAEAADKEAKAKIDAIYDELLKDPASFDKLAQEKSDCPSGKRDNGKLPAFDKEGMLLDGGGAMDQTFATAAFGIEKAGQITKPVKTKFGYHIIKLIEKTPEEVTPIEKVKDKLTEYLAAEKAQADLNKMLDDEIAKNAKINDFAPAKEAPAESK
ncbi:MAG: peptidylprolyl isomerase [Lentisphaeria bacterium]|nr:peptidylprolyl isomerase [Lentisphaeria bacterium]